MERRYSALGLIAVLYQISGGLIFLAALVLGGLSLVTASSSYAYSGFMTTTALTTMIAGALSGVALYAFGELINLLRDMELNSRETAAHAAAQAEYSRRMAYSLEQLAYRRQQQQAQRQIPRPPQG